MKLTGKCLKDFENWASKRKEFQRQFLELHLIVSNHLVIFNNLPDSMKYGVYVDFFDSVSINLDTILGEVILYSYLKDDLKTNYAELKRSKIRIKRLKKANNKYNCIKI